jgi:hypothetical protein
VALGMSAKRNIPVTPTYTVNFHPHSSPFTPTTQNSKGEGPRGDFLAIGRCNRGIQGVRQDFGPPTWLDRIPPSVPALQQHFHHVGGIPMEFLLDLLF